MEGDTFSGIDNGTQLDTKVLQVFQKSFVQVQDILDQNRLLINEINQNHESKVPDNLSRNVGLIKELNNNIRELWTSMLIFQPPFSNPWIHHPRRI
ncbi:Protein ELF4-LIKE 3 [Hibiscus syriacus]|uniref:Protein ELF4-LIKE 3 n=1 Tax=Hibiscus syriacus TaxID=106335 RepID=A0A6A2XC98_HIBSY|nr:Protein ELF4-LIKE 3 [Hibiscus syriacus]